jgi:hypothetical protein
MLKKGFKAILLVVELVYINNYFVELIFKFLLILGNFVLA